jgi:hypothetical protein
MTKEKEIYNNSFFLLKNIHNFYNNCNNNIKYTFFIDHDDFIIFKDNNDILNYTEKLSKKIIKKNNDYEETLYILIVCYVLCIKYYTDCSIYKIYSNIINLLNFNWLKIKKFKKLEIFILNKINYNFN